MNRLSSIPNSCGRVGLRAVALTGVVIGSLALPSPSIRAQEDAQPPANEEVLLVNPAALLVVRPAGQEDFLGSAGSGELTVDLFAAEELAGVVDDEPGAPTMSFGSVREALRAARRQGLTIQAVYFSSDDILQQTDRPDLGLLGLLAERGLAVGVHGDGNLLRQKLGLAAVDTGATPPPAAEGEPREIVFVRVAAATRRVEAFNHATDHGEIFGQVVNGLLDWIEVRDRFVDVAAEADPSPWNAIYHNIWKGNTVADTGVEEGEQAGTYQFEMTVYLLSKADPNVDWWRVDLASFSGIENYVKSTKHCGWWTRDMTAVVALHDGAEFWDYMPDTTVENRSKSSRSAAT